MFVVFALAEIAQHVGLDVYSKDLSLGHPLGNSDAEISGARTEIGNDRSRHKLQSVHHLARFLPRITVWIIELFGPLFRVLEGVMHARRGAAHLMIADTAVLKVWIAGLLSEARSFDGQGQGKARQDQC